MDARKLSDTLLTIGTIGTVGAIIWWAAFYGEAGVGREAIGCLWSRAGPCGFISGLAQFAGKTPYNPALFWIGVVALICGFVVRTALTQQDQQIGGDRASRTSSVSIVAIGEDSLSGSRRIQGTYCPSGSHVAVEGQLTATTGRLIFTPRKNPLHNLFRRQPSPVEIPVEKILSIDQESRGSLRSLIKITAQSGVEYRFIVLASEKGRIFESKPGETESTVTSNELFCTNCGKQVDEGDKFCSRCGAGVS